MNLTRTSAKNSPIYFSIKIMEIESKQPHSKASLQRGRQILERRKEIEQELVDMLKETESDFTLDHVRDVIYNEEDNDDMIYPIGYKVIQRGEVVAGLTPVVERNAFTTGQALRPHPGRD